MAKKSEPIDIKEPDAQAPASAELDIQPEDLRADITYDGKTYKVDFTKVNDIEVLEAFQRGNRFFPPEMNGALTALQKSLGPDYEKFKADQQRKHGTCSATAIFEMFALVDRGAGGN